MEVKSLTPNLAVSFFGSDTRFFVFQVAEILEKYSIEMANEVKSEIRDVVSAVDVFIAPDNQDKHIYSRTSSAGTCNEDINIPEEEKYTPGSSSDTVIQKINKSLSTNKLDTDELTVQEKSFKNKVVPSTVASVSSQDSGINLSFHEQDQNPNMEKTRSNSESLHGHRKSESEIRYGLITCHKLLFTILLQSNT